jgi:selenocysteine lyase/cysteine desulfurase
LHHAAISPPCEPVVRAVGRALADYARSGAGAFARWQVDRERVRSSLARLIGAKESEIALGSNTSRGVSDIALSIPWQKGDRVVLFRGEFPANVTPWQRAAELFGLELEWLDPDAFRSGQGLASLRAVLQRGARLVAVSFVQFQTGLRMPLQSIGALCHEYGAELFVDAIQGLGAVPFDVRALHVDYASAGGHKWLLGTEGAAFVYADEAKARRLRPYTAGWLSHEQPEVFLFQGAGLLDYEKPLKQDARVFETGTSSLLSLAALGASLPLIAELGVTAIYEHVSNYHDRLEPELVARGFTSLRARDPALRSGILSVELPQGVELAQFAQALCRRGVVVGTPDGKLRFAPHFPNSLEEIPLVAAALDEALVECRGR